jgi:hypothetical protein
MIHNIAFRANWDQIQKRKQDIINKHNQKENKSKSQIPYEYKVEDQVLLETLAILRILSTPVQDHIFWQMYTRMVQSESKKAKGNCIIKSGYP